MLSVFKPSILAAIQKVRTLLQVWTTDEYRIQLQRFTICQISGIGQNGRRLYRKKGMEDCGYMVCGSQKFFDPFVNYEPNIKHTL